MFDKSKTFPEILQDFEDAAIDLSWLGASDPEDHEDIRNRYQQTKKELIEVVDRLFGAFKRRVGT